MTDASATTSSAVPPEFVHSIRTPLGALVAALEVAKIADNEAQLADALAVALRQADRISMAVQELEGFVLLANPESQRPRAVLICPLIDRIWQTGETLRMPFLPDFSAKANSSGATATSGASQLAVMADPQLLWLALKTLRSYAIKQGCVDKPSVLVEANAIYLSGHADNAEISTVHKPEKPAGLELARRVAELLGGSLNVRSEPAGCWGFTLSLPSFRT